MVISCVSCGGKLNVPEKFAGKQFNCPKCKTAQTAPLGGCHASGSKNLARYTFEAPPPIPRTKPTQNFNFCPSRGKSVIDNAIQCPHCQNHLLLCQGNQDLTLEIRSENASRENLVVVYAGFWQRFTALVVDNLILIACFKVGNFIAGHVFNEMGAKLAEYFALPFIGILYFSFLESSAAKATWGKSLTGLCVVDQDGNRISFSRASSRQIRKFKSFIIFLAGYLMQPFTEKKQALHDILTETFVVKK